MITREMYLARSAELHRECQRLENEIMSPMMKRFLTSYLAWAKAMKAGESTEGMPLYSRYVGLCCNTMGYVEFSNDIDVEPENLPDYWHDYRGGDMTCVAADALRDELDAMFADDDLSCTFPFGYDTYHFRQGAGTMYACPKRLAWIESKVGA